MSALKISKENSRHKNNLSICSESGNIVFLGNKNPTPKKEKNKKENPVTENEYRDDAEKLPATALMEKYILTYSAWKNMKTRCKKHGKILDPRFNEFRQFLMLMGPRGSSDFTLDRVDNENHNYSPENCRWADKHTQNQNKGNNVYLTYKGETQTVSVWAAKTKQKADTLYHRKSNGWSDEEVITGQRLSIPAKLAIEEARLVALKKLPLEVVRDVTAQLCLELDARQEELIGFQYALENEGALPPQEKIDAHNRLVSLLDSFRRETWRRMPGFDFSYFLSMTVGELNRSSGRGVYSKAYRGYLAEMYRLTGDVRFKEKLNSISNE